MPLKIIFDFSENLVILFPDRKLLNNLMSTLSVSPSKSQDQQFHVARQARFGRAPRILPPAASIKSQRASRRRSDTEKAFESEFTRGAHLQRFQAVQQAVMQLGEVNERVCRSYATYSDSSGNQFAVIKPLSDGGLRIGVGDFEGISDANLDKSVGLGSSSRINCQFQLESFEVISGKQLGLLRRAYNAAVAQN